MLKTTLRSQIFFPLKLKMLLLRSMTAGSLAPGWQLDTNLLLAAAGTTVSCSTVPTRHRTGWTVNFDRHNPRPSLLRAYCSRSTSLLSLQWWRVLSYCLLGSGAAKSNYSTRHKVHSSNTVCLFFKGYLSSLTDKTLGHPYVTLMWVILLHCLVRHPMD